MVAGRVPWPVEWRWQQQAGGAERLAHRLRMASAQAETIRPGDWSAARGLATAQGMRDCKASPHAVPKPAESRRGGTTEVSARRHAGAGCSHPRSVLPPLARPARARLRASRRLRARTPGALGPRAARARAGRGAPRTASAVPSPSQRDRQLASTAATSARASSCTRARCSRPTNDSA